MKTNGRARAGLMVMLGLSLAACGGGGSGDTSSSSNGNGLSAVQQTANEAYTSSIYSVATNLPASGLPVPGTHFAYATRYQVPAPLTVNPQVIQEGSAALSANLPTPTPSSTSSVGSRALINGSFFMAGTGAAFVERLWLDRDGVVSEQLSTDGVTAMPGTLYVSYEKIALSGAIANAPLEVRTWPGLSVFSSNTSLLKAGATFAPGAAYYKRKSVRHGDAVLVYDCGAATNTATPSPCGTATTIEAAFATGSGNMGYRLSDGTLQNVQGLRAWVGNTPDASSSTYITTYWVLFERNGAVYRGLLQRDGTVVHNSLGTGAPVDYTLRFNQQALDSLKAALTF
jgi:hypothetical protein